VFVFYTAAFCAQQLMCVYTASQKNCTLFVSNITLSNEKGSVFLLTVKHIYIYLYTLCSVSAVADINRDAVTLYNT